MAALITTLIVLAALAAVMLVRTLRFRPRSWNPVPAEEISIDDNQAVEHLREMIRCKTVSSLGQEDSPERIRFRTLLPQLYPQVFDRCTVERVDATGLLIRWKGRSGGDPAVFLSHYDVVPAEGAGWEKPPFDAILENGVLWGRGTLDMKNQLCGVLEAMEYLISRDFTPARDIYFALSGEEEIMGPTAASIRDLFVARGITPAFVLDEGGDIMDGFFPGADVPCAMVGTAEKGVANLYFTARSAGGHASIPTADNPLERLCRAMSAIPEQPFPQRGTAPLEAMIDTMGRYCPFRTRLLLANRDLLLPLYFRWLRKQGGMLAAGSRTTFALTQARGSDAGNVIPSEAEMFANVRMLWGDTTESVIRRLQRYIHDPEVEIRAVRGTEPRPASACTAGWQELQNAIHATWPQAVVSPYLMVATTDSRHWRDICPNVYRFSAKTVTREEKATVHGDNERIRVENTIQAARFFVRLMEQC